MFKKKEKKKENMEKSIEYKIQRFDIFENEGTKPKGIVINK